jgi:hypothetical protein
MIAALMCALIVGATAFGLWLLAAAQCPEVGRWPQWWVVAFPAATGAMVAFVLSPAATLAVGLPAAALFVGAGTDVRRMLLLDSVAIVGLLLTLFAAGYAGSLAPASSGAILLFVCFGAANAVAARFGKSLYGWGDVKIAPIVGAMLGPTMGMVAFAFAVAGVSAQMLMQRRDAPLGPVLAIACVSTLAGEQILGGAIGAS